MLVADIALRSVAIARLRNGHLREATREMVLVRHGSQRSWGVPWLDEAGEDVGTGRLWRAVGLPPPLPDVLGVAVRFRDADGAGPAHDLLLGSTGLGRLTRFVLRPRVDPATSYCSIVPYRTPRGLVLIAARPADPGAVERRTSDELHLRLLAGAPDGAWERFGDLHVGAAAAAGTSPDVDEPAFDAVLHPLPGLVVPLPLVELRERSCAAGRRGRDAGPARP